MIVLDTHTWLWWASSSKRLSAKARSTISASELKLVSAISIWEIAMLVEKQRLGLDRDVDTWVGQALSLPGIQLCALAPSISIRSTRLPGSFHGDPADRIIVASALEYGVPLVTKDKAIRNYRHVASVW